MNTKNRVVYPIVIMITLTLSGCFPWSYEERSVDIVQQIPTEEKVITSAALEIDKSETTVPQENQEIILPDIHLESLVNTQEIPVVSTKKRNHRARRRRKENKESIPSQKAKSKTQHTNIVPASDSGISNITSTNTQERSISPAPDSIVKQDEHHIIEIRNAISVDDLTVKHWTGTYAPTKLAITVNDVPFTIVGTDAAPLGTTKKIQCTDNQVTVEYTYEFLNGMRKGSDSITYVIDEKTSSLPLRFSWDTAWHVELDGAQRQN